MRQFPRKLVSQSSQAGWLNQLRDCVEERTPLNSPSVTVDADLKGFRMKAKVTAEGTGGNRIIRARIHNIFNDIFECQQVNETDVGFGSFFFVARPPALRIPFPTPGGVGWGEQKRPFIYPVTGSSHNVTPFPVAMTETIYPAYLKGATTGTIIVCGEPEKTTGVPTPVLFPERGLYVPWIDLNVDGRHWRVDFTAREYEACKRTELPDGTIVSVAGFVQLVGGEFYVEGQ